MYKRFEDWFTNWFVGSWVKWILMPRAAQDLIDILDESLDAVEKLNEANKNVIKAQDDLISTLRILLELKGIELEVAGK